MRHYDFTPLTRSSIGFDHLFDLFNNTRLHGGEDHYPPYDIVRVGADSYRIALAVAGFAPENLAITAQQNLLTIVGRRPANGDHQYLHQGISAQPFERSFSLADHVEVVAATYDNGLLLVDLVRKLPEAMKPRRIEIGVGPGKGAKAKAGQIRVT